MSQEFDITPGASNITYSITNPKPASSSSLETFQITYSDANSNSIILDLSTYYTQSQYQEKTASSDNTYSLQYTLPEGVTAVTINICKDVFTFSSPTLNFTRTSATPFFSTFNTVAYVVSGSLSVEYGINSNCQTSSSSSESSSSQSEESGSTPKPPDLGSNNALIISLSVVIPVVVIVVVTLSVMLTRPKKPKVKTDDQ
jgi:hypothetical protein